MFQVTPWSTLPLIVIFLAAWTMASLKTKNDIPGTRAVKWLLIGAIVWSAAQFLRTLVTDLELKVFTLQLEMIGKQIVPTAWFIFTITYANNKSAMSQRALVILSVLPVTTLLLTFSNSYHHFIWASTGLTSFGNFVGVDLHPGPWFIVISIYAVSLVMSGTVIAVHKLSQSRGRAISIVSLILVPVIVCIVTITQDAGLGPVQGIDLTPLGLIVGALLLRSGVLNAGLLTAKRVRRHTVFERLSDMIVIVDQQANVLDYNDAAKRGMKIQSAPGESYPRLELPVLLEMIRTHGQRTELTIGERAYDVHATSLSEAGQPDSGERALVFRDVTQRRKTERALQEAKKNLQTQAHTDPLTGLYNRRFFMQRLAEEGERLRRHHNTLSCLLFDLDHFKKVNDTYGHDTGDAVLRMVSRMTNQATRITDVAARIGGEEFAMLLPETDAQGAINLANRLRLSIANSEVIANNQRVKVTASIGIVTVNRVGDNLDALLGMADKALYRAKDGGRNMVCVAN